MSLYFVPTISFAVGFLALRVLLLPRARTWFLDQPNHRSLHHSPIPRTGGIAIVLALLASAVWLREFNVLYVGVLLLSTVSLVDDWRGLHQGVRLAAHLLIAFLYLHSSGLDTMIHGYLLATLAIAWVTNLYNFMDGSDGLAGGMATFGFSFYALAAWMNDALSFAVLCLCVVAAVLPFLVANFSPSKIFLGDAGSIPLGFLASALGMFGWLKGYWNLCFPILVFSPFIVDASVTLARRGLRRERFWQAHREHYYQRLVRMGWTHRKTALAEYLVMVIMGFLGLLTLADSAWLSGLALALAAVLYLLLAGMIDSAWDRHLVMNKA